MKKLADVIYRFKNQDGRIYETACSSLIFIYAVFMVIVCADTKAVSVDEQWFWRVAANDVSWKSFADIIQTPNYLGYGSIYWIILRAVNDFFIVRILWAALLVSAVCMVPYVMKNFLQASKKQIFFAVAVYLSCPLAWFTGKIIGPEIMGYAAGVFGCSAGLLGYQRNRWKIYIPAMVLLGISAGIKLNDIVFSIFVFTYICMDRIQGASGRKEIISKSNLKLFIFTGGVLEVGCLLPIRLCC